MAHDATAPIVFANKARCRDCYRCIRVCPVNAIGIRDGQAYVEERLCISCGTCIRECPQQAKGYRNDVSAARELLAARSCGAISIAPSFASLFNDWQRKRLPSALRKLGFTHIAETAVAAWHVARETARCAAARPGKPLIASSCPAVVGYIGAHDPRLLDDLAEVASPMIAHARMLHNRLGPGVPLFFVGPCIAKKAEAATLGAGLIDFALTFEELIEWFNAEGVDLARLEESGFDEQPLGWARTFPLAGGCLRTAAMESDLLSATVVSLTGVDEIRDMLDTFPAEGGIVVEPLFCRGGCIGGPAMPCEATALQRRRAVLDYAAAPVDGGDEAGVPLDVIFPRTADAQPDVPESRILDILAATGKQEPADQLNCGACGYPTCRAQAIAAARKMAEPQMCVPYMRRLAEQRTDRIIETSPNGIVILDEHLDIISMNPSFKRMFMCTESLCGKKISCLMDPELFDSVAARDADLLERTVEHTRYGLVCHQVVYVLREEKQYVGVFVNMTNSLLNQRKLDELRSRTLQQARDLLDHQTEIARRIAQFLGDSAAQGEKLLDNLMTLARDREPPHA